MEMLGKPGIRELHLATICPRFRKQNRRLRASLFCRMIDWVVGLLTMPFSPWRIDGALRSYNPNDIRQIYRLCLWLLKEVGFRRRNELVRAYAAIKEAVRIGILAENDAAELINLREKLRLECDVIVSGAGTAINHLNSILNQGLFVTSSGLMPDGWQRSHGEIRRLMTSKNSQWLLDQAKEILDLITPDYFTFCEAMDVLRKKMAEAMLPAEHDGISQPTIKIAPAT